MALRTDYKNTIIDTSVNARQKFNMISNADGTVSFEDVTTYKQIGDAFDAADINETNEDVNNHHDSLTSLFDYNASTGALIINLDALEE